MVNSLAALFGLIIAIHIGIFIEAFILRICCTLYNFLVVAPQKPSGPTAGGQPEIDIIGHPEQEAIPDDWVNYERSVTFPGVPRPTLERAMRIIFFAAVVNTTGAFIILYVIRFVVKAAAHGTISSLWILVCFVPLGILVLGGMNAAMLPTSSGKGMLVSLLFHLLNFLVAAILAAVLVLIALALGLGLPRFG